MAKYKDKGHKGVVYTIERFDAIKVREKYKGVDHQWRQPIVPQPENFLVLACTLLPEMHIFYSFIELKAQ